MGPLWAAHPQGKGANADSIDAVAITATFAAGQSRKAAVGARWLFRTAARPHAAAPVHRGATVSGRTTYTMLNGIELTTDGADLSADLELLGRTWPGSVPVTQLTADRRLLLQVYGSRGLELRVRPIAAVTPGDRPLVDQYTRTRARIDGRLASQRHTILSLDDPLTRRAVFLMDGTMTRASIAHELTHLPEAPPDVPRALDELLDELGRASLFLA